MDNHGLAHWTIKNMPVETRQEAVACAARAGLSVAQWMVHAVRTQAQLDAGPPPPLVPRKAPIALAPDPADGPALPHLTELLRETRAAFQAASLPLPAKIANAALSLSMSAVREAKQSSRSRARARKAPASDAATDLANGKTLSLEHNPEV